jgi:hypothetical protein
MKHFDISPNTMVVTSVYVTQQAHPILCVSHEDDAEEGIIWQFHCGNGDYDMAKMQLVRLETILRIDPSVAEVADMPVGHAARRASKNDPWRIRPE